MDGSAIKGKLSYPIFVLIGLLSLPIGLVLIGPLAGIIIGIQNILCDFGWCGFDLLWACQFLFPFLICSILLALVLYYKEPSFAFASKVFVLSFAANTFLFFGGLSFFYLIQLPIHPFLIVLLILMITFIVGLIFFKDRPLFGFALRAFSLSSSVVILAISVWFILSMSMSGGGFISIDDIGVPGENVKYAQITEMELEEYPDLEKAINEYNINNSHYTEVNYEEWGRTRDFIEKKGHESRFLFSIKDEGLEDELNMSIIPEILRNAFDSNGYKLSEYSSVYKVYPYLQSNWAYRITEKQYLFNITDAEAVEELNRISSSTEGRSYTPESKEDLIPPKVKNSFVSEGFLLPEDTRLLREETDAWYLFFGGTSYRILSEKGILNVFSEERNAYEIWKEEGILNVYETNQGSDIFKVNGRFLKFGFGHAD